MNVHHCMITNKTLWFEETSMKENKELMENLHFAATALFADLSLIPRYIVIHFRFMYRHVSHW